MGLSPYGCHTERVDSYPLSPRRYPCGSYGYHAERIDYRLCDNIMLYHTEASSASTDDSGGCGTGCIIGIIVGILVFIILAIIGVVVTYVCYKKFKG